jgi:hypothetical protein
MFCSYYSDLEYPIIGFVAYDELFTSCHGIKINHCTITCTYKGNTAGAAQHGRKDMVFQEGVPAQERPDQPAQGFPSSPTQRETEYLSLISARQRYTSHNPRLFPNVCDVFD